MPGILVTQLARMGDLVQSLYLLEDLKKAEGREVSLLVDKRLASFAASRAPWLDAVHGLDLERYLRGFRNRVPWEGLWQTLHGELQPLGHGRFERIINLNYGNLASCVVEAVRGDAPVEGFHTDVKGSFGQPWVDLISRLVQENRKWNRFHLVDVFRFHAARRLPPARIETRASRPLDERSVLAVQVATRGRKRTWKAERFIEVIRGLHADVGCEILLLGEARERALAESIRRRAGSGRVDNLVGRTSLEDLVQILLGCDRLLSGDTGTLHLACRLGVPSLAVFFGPAYVFETGPYGAGHVVVQAEPACAPCHEDEPCGDTICSGQVLSRTLLRLLEGEESGASPGVHVYTSGFVGDWMQYRPVHRKKAGPDDVVGYLYWGGAGEFLGGREGRLPSRDTAMEFLAANYRLEPAVLDAAGSCIDSTVPQDLRNTDRERLRLVLHRGWRRMKEMHDEYSGEEPYRPAASAA